MQLVQKGRFGVIRDRLQRLITLTLALLLCVLAQLAVPMEFGGCGHAYANQPTIYVGYRSLVTRLPGSRIRLDVAVWYPTSKRSTSEIKTGSWVFRAARNATPLPGPWPLIVLSHDSSGSRYAHHDLATELAQMGFIVAAPTHDGDNADDMRLMFSDLQLPTRAYQLQAALDLVLDDNTLGPEVDRRRIVLLGFGRGGTAGLLLAGGTLTPDVWPDYCPRLRTAGQTSPYCEPFVARKMDALVQSMKDRAQALAEAEQIRAKAEQIRQNAFLRAKDGLLKAYGRVQRAQKSGSVTFPVPPTYLPPLPPLRTLQSPLDPRYHAMIFVSPGYSMLFDPESLRAVNLPILLIAADKDILDLPEQQAMRYRSLLSPPVPDYLTLEGADIPALQALCPPEVARDLPDLCASVTPDERKRLHQSLRNSIVDYLKRIWR